MDRKYLAATLAIVATFAVMSRGLRSGKVTTLACRGYGALIEHFHEKSSRVITRVRVPLRPSHPEEAQMLAEMNLPLVRERAKVAALVARQNVEAAKCDREQALRQAAQARREAQRAQQEAMRARHEAAVSFARPIVMELGGVGGIQHQIQVQTERLAAAKVDFTTEQLTRLNDAAARLATVQLQSADLASQAAASAEGSGCAMSRVWSRQLQAQYRNAMRNALHAIQNSVNSKNAGKAAVNTGGYL